MNDVHYAGPTKTRMNPSAPEEAEFYDSAAIIHVIEDANPEKTRVRCWTTFGGPGMEVGEESEFRHGWDGGSLLGWWRCIGTVHTDGTTEGEIPDRRLPHWVAK